MFNRSKKQHFNKNQRSYLPVSLCIVIVTLLTRVCHNRIISSGKRRNIIHPPSVQFQHGLSQIRPLLDDGNGVGRRTRTQDKQDLLQEDPDKWEEVPIQGNARLWPSRHRVLPLAHEAAI